MIAGFSSVAGICADASSSSSSSITNCYNTGYIDGNDRAGGICGYASSISMTACYNTGNINGADQTGGICGSVASISMTVCYNTGEVTGGRSNVGGICGLVGSPSSFSIAACYWIYVPGTSAATSGIGNLGNNGPSDVGTTILGSGAWPDTADDPQWGMGDGSGDGTYWKSLGGWYGGNPVYPKLYFEE
jgi:hypothetical protein